MSKGIITDRELSQQTYKGQNTILLIEKITRERIFDSLYWKQYCFNISPLDIMDRCVDHVRCVGGLESSGRPLPFICLLVKLIQLHPDRTIIEFYIKQEKFKYLKMLGLLYERLVYRQANVLRSELDDYRKLRVMENGAYRLSYVDEVVDALIENGMFIGLNLPYMNVSGTGSASDSSDSSDSSDDSDSDSE